MLLNAQGRFGAAGVGLLNPLKDCGCVDVGVPCDMLLGSRFCLCPLQVLIVRKLATAGF